MWKNKTINKINNNLFLKELLIYFVLKNDKIFIFFKMINIFYKTKIFYTFEIVLKNL